MRLRWLSAAWLLLGAILPCSPVVGCGASVAGGDGTACTGCAIPDVACWDGSAPYRCAIVAGACGAVYDGCPAKPTGDCATAECGPALRTPSYTCEDGSLGGNTGRCLRDEASGACGWELRDCPRKCEDGECGPLPPTPACPVGSTAELRCRRQTDSTCRWVQKCAGATPTCPDARTWPDFSRACKVAADCATVEHQIDCCGTHQVLGIAASERERAAAAEKAWAPKCPLCDCVARPTADDAGATGTAFGVRCTGGVCTSYAYSK